MFHDAGSRAPPGPGDDHAEEGGQGGRQGDPAQPLEITVAPRRQRFVTEVGYRHPGLASRIQRSGGADRLADELAAGQSDKR